MKIDKKPSLKYKLARTDDETRQSQEDADKIQFPNSDLMTMLSRSQADKKTEKRVLRHKWKDTKRLSDLQKGVEKHGTDWSAIRNDKTLNLVNLSPGSLKNAYYTHLRRNRRKNDMFTTQDKKTSTSSQALSPPSASEQICCSMLSTEGFERRTHRDDEHCCIFCSCWQENLSDLSKSQESNSRYAEKENCSERTQ